MQMQQDEAISGVCYGPNGLVTEWELITPEIAELYLENNRDILKETGKAPNRTIAARTVNGYTYDMNNGNWVPTHQGIAFRAGDEALIDGQHRLNAIIKSQKAQMMLVTRNVPQKAVLFMDAGRFRSAANSISIGTGQHLSRNDGALIKAIITHQKWAVKDGGHRLNTSQILKAYEMYSYDIDNFMNTIGKSRIIAPIRAAAFGAYYHHKHDSDAIDSLDRFLKVAATDQMVEGLSAEEFNFIIRFKKRLATVGGRGAPAREFALADWVIYHHINSTGRKNIISDLTNYKTKFPIPDPFIDDIR